MLLPSCIASLRESRCRVGSCLWRFGLGSVLQFGALLGTGCSGSEQDRYPGDEAGQATLESAASSIDSASERQRTSLARGQCEEASVKECKVLLPSGADVTNCMVGLQVCVAGEWGDCLSESDAEARLPSGE